MGESDLVNNCIRCPWHNKNSRYGMLRRRSLPAVRVGSVWTALLPIKEPSARVVVMPLYGSTAGAGSMAGR